MSRRTRLAALWVLFAGTLAAVVVAPGGWTHTDGRHIALAIVGLILALNLAARDYEINR